MRRRKLPAVDLAWVGLIPAAAITLAAVLWLAPLIDGRFAPPSSYHPFPAFDTPFYPEPLEEARFVIVIAAAFVFAAVVLAFGSPRPGEKRLDLTVLLVQVAALAFIGWGVLAQENGLPLYPGVNPAPHYLPELLLGHRVLVAGALLGLAATALCVRGKPIPLPGRELVAGIGRVGWLPVAIAILATVIWLLPAVVTDANLRKQGLLGFHAPLQFEDYAAAVNGRTPLVDYVAWYASLLPIAFAPLLRTFDTSVTSFSLLQCGLSLIGLLCVYAAFVQVTGRRWVALAGYLAFLSISFVPWHPIEGAVRQYNGLYYAAFPTRYLGPFLLTWLLARRLRRGSPPLWVLYLVAGLSAFNNFEFGICALVALVVASLARIDWRARRREDLAELLVQGTLGLLGALVVVTAVTLIRTGEVPDFSLLTYWSLIFARQGFGLLPMDPIEFHWALYFTYLAALVTAAVGLVRGGGDRVTTVMLVFAGTLGLTTAQYFAGRSEGTQLLVLFPVWGLNLTLLTWLLVGFLRETPLSSARRMILPTLAVFAGFGTMVAASWSVPLPWQQVDRILSTGGPQFLGLHAAQSFVEDHTRPGEPVMMVTTAVDHRVADRAGVVDVSPFGTNAYFSPEEVDRALDQLDDSGGTKIFEALTPTRSSQSRNVGRLFTERGYRMIATDPTGKINLWVFGSPPS